jgi:hypothetical protein
MMERKCLSTYLFCVLLLLFLCGCPYESKVPLSVSSQAKIDKELIGDWKFEPTPMNDEKESAGITIYSFNDHEFFVCFWEILEGKDEILLLKVFVTTIDDTKFLNVQELDYPPKERGWLFYSYSVSGDILTLRGVEDTLFKQDFTTSKTLRKFFKDNLGNKELYGKDSKMVLKRIKE